MDKYCLNATQARFLEVVIKIEVKDNNVEQALRVLKENSREMDFLR